MKKALIMGGIITALFVGALFFYRRRKAAATEENGLTPGGIFAPKTLTEADYLELEKIFQSGNPYSNELAKRIEGQGIDENSPTRPDGTQKTAVTKEQFNNLVLSLIRRNIANRSEWIQDEEKRRFEPWSGAARAGYNDSLARAFAYVIRVYVGKDNYWTDGANTGTTTQTQLQKLVSEQQPALTQFHNLEWKQTNIGTIIKAAYLGTVIFWDLSQKKTITTTEAKSRGVAPLTI